MSERGCGVRRQRGVTIFELVAVICVIGVLAAVLLERFQFYQEASEKAAMDLTARNINTGLQLQMAALISRGQERKIADLARYNPVKWLVEPPKNYAGEYASPNLGEIPTGVWFFDTDSRELVYAVNLDRHFSSGDAERKFVRYRVKLIFSNSAQEVGETSVNGTVAGVSFRAVDAYRWLEP